MNNDRPARLTFTTDGGACTVLELVNDGPAEPPMSSDRFESWIEHRVETEWAGLRPWLIVPCTCLLEVTGKLDWILVRPDGLECPLPIPDDDLRAL